MAEYMVKLRINDDYEKLGREAVRDCVDQMIESVDASPFGFEIDDIVLSIPKAVDDIILYGKCPHCGKESLSEYERGEEWLTFECLNCKDDRYIHISRDDMGIRRVTMSWFDKDEMDKVIYDRNDR